MDLFFFAKTDQRTELRSHKNCTRPASLSLLTIRNEARARGAIFLEENIFHSVPTPNSVIAHLLEHPDHRSRGL